MAGGLILTIDKKPEGGENEKKPKALQDKLRNDMVRTPKVKSEGIFHSKDIEAAVTEENVKNGIIKIIGNYTNPQCNCIPGKG